MKLKMSTFKDPNPIFIQRVLASHSICDTMYLTISNEEHISSIDAKNYDISLF